MQKAIEISDLSFRYADVETDTLRIDSWHCGEGERVFLSGASGSGKSSLIKLLAGLLSPQSGAIKILGTTVSELSQAKRDAFRAANIGIVFQQFNLIPFLSALENLHLAQSFSAQNDASKQDFAKSLLNAVNIKGDQVGKPTGNLSVGQQQRVAIARALVNKPKIILADEPTSSLDAGNTDIFLELLFSLADNFGSTLLFVSHDAQLQARFGSVQSIENLTLADHVTGTVADQDKDKSKALEMYR